MLVPYGGPGMWSLVRRRSPSAADPHYEDSRSLPFLDSSGSVHAERSKQHGRRLPFLIFEMLTSTRRWRVAGFLVAATQRTHSTGPSA